MGQDQSALTRDTERDNPYHSDKADIYGVLCSETPCNCILSMLRTLFNRKTIKLRIVFIYKACLYHSVREQQTVREGQSVPQRQFRTRATNLTRGTIRTKATIKQF